MTNSLSTSADNRQIAERVQSMPVWRTAKDVFLPENEGLRSIYDQHQADPEGTVKLIEQIVGFMVMSLLNISPERSLTPRQISLIADAIIHKHGNLKFPEVAMVIRKGVSGEFGPIEFKVDPSNILFWFSQYRVNERRHHRNEAKGRLEAKAAKNPKAVPMPEKIKAKIKNGVNRIGAIPKTELPEYRDLDEYCRKKGFTLSLVVQRLRKIFIRNLVVSAGEEVLENEEVVEMYVANQMRRYPGEMSKRFKNRQK